MEAVVFTELVRGTQEAIADIVRMYSVDLSGNAKDIAARVEVLEHFKIGYTAEHAAAFAEYLVSCGDLEKRKFTIEYFRMIQPEETVQPEEAVQPAFLDLPLVKQASIISIFMKHVESLEDSAGVMAEKLVAVAAFKTLYPREMAVDFAEYVEGFNTVGERETALLQILAQ